MRGEGRHEDSDRRHDNGNEQQGNRRHNNGDGRHDQLQDLLLLHPRQVDLQVLPWGA